MRTARVRGGGVGGPGCLAIQLLSQNNSSILGGIFTMTKKDRLGYGGYYGCYKYYHKYYCNYNKPDKGESSEETKPAEQ